MCGIVCLIGDMDYKHKDILKQMLVVTSFRGAHSTGVVGANVRTNEIKMAKVVGNPFELFEYKPFDLISPALMSCVIGHGRHATQGEITRANAHPFQHEQFTGVHNGTLSNHRSLLPAGSPLYGTDSETIYASFAMNGVEETIRKLRGAYALCWYDASDKTFNVIRNKERPLWYCMSDDGKRMYVASEHSMLNFVLNRNGVKVWRDEKGYSYFPFAEDTWFKIKVPANGNEKVEILSQTIVKGDESKQHNGFFPGMYRSPWGTTEVDDDLNDRLPGSLGGSGHQNGQQGTTQTRAGFGTTNSSTTSSNRGTEVTSRDSTSTLTLIPGNKSENSEESSNTSGNVRRGFVNNYLTREEFDSITKYGCSYCQEDVAFEDCESLKWIDKETVLCKTCWPEGPADKQEEKPKWHSNTATIQTAQ